MKLWEITWVELGRNLHAKLYTYYPCNFFFGIEIMMYLQGAVVTD